jgi:hypothetical protein
MCCRLSVKTPRPAVARCRGKTLEGLAVQTLLDVEPSRNGIPARAHNQQLAVLAKLCERGSLGVLSSELYAEPLVFGRSPRNYISVLRRQGFDIHGESRGESDWHYVLLTKPSLADWYEEATNEQAAARLKTFP